LEKKQLSSKLPLPPLPLDNKNLKRWLITSFKIYIFFFFFWFLQSYSYFYCIWKPILVSIFICIIVLTFRHCGSIFDKVMWADFFFFVSCKDTLHLKIIKLGNLQRNSTHLFYDIFVSVWLKWFSKIGITVYIVINWKPCYKLNDI
jgi:hypothetical protein